jgi:ankyrin repeat protein
MMLLFLPLELLFCLADFLNGSQDLLSMARLNRRSSLLFLPLLYTFNVRCQNSSALIWAIQHNQSKLAKTLLEEYRANPNTMDGRLRTPLFYIPGIRTERHHVIRFLIRNGADLNWRDDHQQTPLLYSLQRKFLPVARDLLGYSGTEVTARDNKGRNVIWYAIAHQDKELIQAFLDRGVDTLTADCKGIDPINIAILNQSSAVLTMLLDHIKKKPSAANLDGLNSREHPLFIATRKGSIEMVRILISYGANLNIRNRKGQNLLHQAAIKGSSDILQTFLDYNMIPINATDTRGATALHLAAERGHKSIVKILLAFPGMEIDSRDGDETTSLCIAFRENKQSAALQILCDGSADINASCRRGQTALHHAVKNGNILLVCVLLEIESLDPNIRDGCGWTPITYAVLGGSLRLLEVLLTRQDIALNVRNASPIFWACEKGHMEIVRRLLDHNDVDIDKSVWNKSPLYIAIENGHTEIAKLLIDRCGGIDVNSPTLLGSTALSVAASSGNLEIVEILLQDERLNCKAENSFGETALQLAAQEGNEAIVRALCRDKRARDLSSLRKAIRSSSNIRLAYFLQGQEKIWVRESSA